jgi:hypothetical protein
VIQGHPPNSKAFDLFSERDCELKFRQINATRRSVRRFHRTRIALNVDVVFVSKQVVERGTTVPTDALAEDGDVMSRKRMVDTHSPGCARTDSHSSLSAGVDRDQTPTVEQRIANYW